MPCVSPFVVHFGQKPTRRLNNCRVEGRATNTNSTSCCKTQHQHDTSSLESSPSSASASAWRLALLSATKKITRRLANLLRLAKPMGFAWLMQFLVPSYVIWTSAFEEIQGAKSSTNDRGRPTWGILRSWHVMADLVKGILFTTHIPKLLSAFDLYHSSWLVSRKSCDCDRPRGDCLDQFLSDRAALLKQQRLDAFKATHTNDEKNFMHPALLTKLGLDNRLGLSCAYHLAWYAWCILMLHTTKRKKWTQFHILYNCFDPTIFKTWRSESRNVIQILYNTW